MNKLYRLFSCGFVLACIIGVVSIPAPADAATHVFMLHDHPNGNQNPPSYGLRLDNIIATDQYTFSFDYADVSGMSNVILTYDDILGEINISGRAYGGKDIGGTWDATEQGWVDIDFTYTTNITEADNCAGDPGGDLHVTGQDATNAGTVTLDGWGGNLVLAISDKAGTNGCSFSFDNDDDPKGNATISGDPSIYSGWGWVMPEDGTRDWIFIGEMLTLPIEETSLGNVKAKYAE